MLALLLSLTINTAYASPSCKGIVATATQREAYTQTMTKYWPKEQQTAYLRHHEKYIKDSEGWNRWGRLYDEERMAIIQYTEGLFGVMNRGLRSENFNLWTEFTTLCSGLNKLENHKGWVYRVVDLTPDLISKIKSTHNYTDPAFMSTEMSQVLIWPKNTLMKLFVRTGKNLMGITSHPEEKEVLVMPGTRFKVHHFQENPVGSKYKYEITLKEESLDI